MRQSFRTPIPEIEAAAKNMDAAVSAHLAGDHPTARELFRTADDAAVREWTESIWGAKSPYLLFRPVTDAPGEIPAAQRVGARYASTETKKRIHERDGYYCRFCKIPVVRMEIRKAINAKYPDVVPWGSSNATQHAGLQCMWAQYDHIIPYSRGGSSDLSNVYLTCAPCNYGRSQFTLEEVDLAHPDTHPIRQGTWYGLERFR